MSCLLIREEQVDSLVTMKDAVRAVEAGFTALGAQRAEHVPRRRCKSRGIVLHSMSASSTELGVSGWKQYTTTREGARFLVGLYENASGRLLALIEANRLGQLRTGAATGLAAAWLKPHAEEAALIGCGYQAFGQLEALVETLDLRRARVTCRDAERRERFAERVSRELGIDAVSVATSAEAAQGCSLIVTATTSRQPVLNLESVAEPALVCAVGSNWLEKSELEPSLVQAAARIVVDSREACRQEAGEFSEGWMPGFQWERTLELAELAMNRELRGDAPGITLFKSVGIALEDLALAKVVYERALERSDEFRTFDFGQ